MKLPVFILLLLSIMFAHATSYAWLNGDRGYACIFGGAEMIAFVLAWFIQDEL